GTGAHRNNIPWFRHLVVDAADHRRHLASYCAGDDHEISLPWRGPKDPGTETIHIVPRRHSRNHFDGAAGETERHRPQGRLSRPIHDRVQIGRQNICLKLSFQKAHLFYSTINWKGIVGMPFTARVERGPSEVARSASTKGVPTVPCSIPF